MSVGPFGPTMVPEEYFDTVMELFKSTLRDAVEGKEVSFSVKKVGEAFENNLRQQVSIITSQKDDEEKQTLKANIEALQVRARVMNNKILESRNRFIADVSREADEEIRARRPSIIEEYDLDSPIDLPPEIEQYIQNIRDSNKLAETKLKSLANEQELREAERFIQDSRDYLMSVKG